VSAVAAAYNRTRSAAAGQRLSERRRGAQKRSAFDAGGPINATTSRAIKPAHLIEPAHLMEVPGALRPQLPSRASAPAKPCRLR
jgi:hypothetical protein